MNGCQGGLRPGMVGKTVDFRDRRERVQGLALLIRPKPGQMTWVISYTYVCEKILFIFILKL